MTPSNTTAATATVIPSLPYDITLDVSEAPNSADGRHAVWYKYTAIAGDILIGLMGFANPLGTYRPKIYVYRGTPEALTSWFPWGAMQCPSTMPVTVGEDYYIKIIDGAAVDPINTDLQFSVLRPSLTSDAIPAGSLLINDDRTGFPAAILSAVDGTLLDLKPMVAGEMGEGLPGTSYLYHNPDDGKLTLYNANLGVVKQITGITSAHTWPQIRANSPSTFFVGDNIGGYTNNATISTVDTDGNVGGTQWTLDEYSIYLCAMAANLDRTVLYYSSNLAISPICRHDLVNDLKLTDFVPGVSGYFLCRDLLVMADGSVVFGYIKSTNNYDCYIVRYAANGSLLNTYPIPRKLNRICKGIDDPTSIWVWDFGTNGNREMRFTNIKLSDGTTLKTFTVPEFQYGVGATASSMDVPRFGISNSCPIALIQGEVAAPEEPVTPYTDVVGGIYYMSNTGKTNDSLYNNLEKPIPTPKIRTAYFGE